jgi:hypothetical protein
VGVTEVSIENLEPNLVIFKFNKDVVRSVVGDRGDLAVGLEWRHEITKSAVTDLPLTKCLETQAVVRMYYDSK